jgi:hypothetical protein
MVSRVVPRASLESAVFSLAAEIAEMPPFGLALAKRAVNQCEDLMGQRAGMDAVFGLHHRHGWSSVTWGVIPNACFPSNAHTRSTRPIRWSWSGALPPSIRCADSTLQRRQLTGTRSLRDCRWNSPGSSAISSATKGR